MGFKWRDNHTEEFLNFYREYECLWNVSNGLYKNKEAREAAYNKICICMKIPELTIADVKNKIKIIRTNYKNELNKVVKSEKSASSVSQIYAPRLFWFKKADEFLRAASIMKPESSNSNYNSNVQAQVENTEDEEIEDERSYNNSNIRDQTIHSATTSSLNEKTNNIRSPRKRSSILLAVEENISKLRRISDLFRDDDEDEFDLFCKSIAMQLRKMPLERALICQQNLQAVMKQERLYQLNYRDLPTYNEDLRDTDWEENSNPTKPSREELRLREENYRVQF